MNRPRLVRRVCRHCQQRKVKKAEHQFCSETCYYASRRTVPAICPVCHERPVSPQGKTCGRSCGARLRVDGGRNTGLRLALAGRRAAIHRRLAELLRDELAALEAAAEPVERAKVLARIYRKGYKNGSSATSMRYAHQRRMAS